jgi:hypothetical protein
LPASTGLPTDAALLRVATAAVIAAITPAAAAKQIMLEKDRIDIPLYEDVNEKC